MVYGGCFLADNDDDKSIVLVSASVRFSGNVHLVTYLLSLISYLVPISNTLSKSNKGPNGDTAITFLVRH